jgi:hypothetical protein
MVLKGYGFLGSCRGTKREATMLTISFWHIWEASNAVRNGEIEMYPSCLVEKSKLLSTW